MKRASDHSDIQRWMDNDDLFISELKSGLDWQHFVASCLLRRGFAVQASVLQVRRNLGEIRDFTANDTDIIVGSWDDQVLVDVKSRKFAFTCPADYPYPTAILDTVRGWEAKARRPHAVILVSQKTRKMVVVPVSTSGLWLKEAVRDRTRSINETNYCCPRGQLRTLDDFCDWLRSRSGMRLAA